MTISKKYSAFLFLLAVTITTAWTDTGNSRQTEVFYEYIDYEGSIAYYYTFYEGDIVHWSFNCESLVWITVMGMDDAQYERFLDNLDFDFYLLSPGIYDIDSGSWTIPSDGIWYIVFLNEDELEESWTWVTINIVIEESTLSGTTETIVSTITNTITTTIPETTTVTEPTTETTTIVTSKTTTETITKTTVLSPSTSTGTADGFPVYLSTVCLVLLTIYRRRRNQK